MLPSQSHHESALPAQRYKFTRQLPHKLNPIVPQDVASYSVDGEEASDFPSGFLELNAPRQRPPLLGNPIFGYSTHPMPPPVLSDELPPTRTTDRGRQSKASSAAMVKLNELQAMLQEERKLRKEVGDTTHTRPSQTPARPVPPVCPCAMCLDGRRH